MNNYNVPGLINTHPLNGNNLSILKICLLTLAIGLTSTSILAETEQSLQKPVEKPTDGKGALPTFAQADVDGDHYVTKIELKNFPYLLQVFDKVDAGEDGKLEQHEYQNLKMETKREGEVR
jgi:hypothetical protein